MGYEKLLVAKNLPEVMFIYMSRNSRLDVDFDANELYSKIACNRQLLTNIFACSQIAYFFFMKDSYPKN